MIKVFMTKMTMMTIMTMIMLVWEGRVFSGVSDAAIVDGNVAPGPISSAPSTPPDTPMMTMIASTTKMRRMRMTTVHDHDHDHRPWP